MRDLSQDEGQRSKVRPRALERGGEVQRVQNVLGVGSSWLLAPGFPPIEATARLTTGD